MNFMLVRVPVDTLAELKLSIWPYLVRGAQIDEGRTLPEDVWDAIVSGVSTLWLVVEGETIFAIVVTSMIDYPSFMACRIELCVGAHRKKWLHLLSDIEEWAKDNGAEVVEGIMRNGWIKDLTDYRTKRVIMEKVL